MITKRTFLSKVAMAGTAAGFGIAARQPAFAQPYPSSVIRIVVPYSASTPPDILARIVATALSDSEGWNVIVENKPGAVMSIGTSEVLRQPADGHTLLSITSPFAAAPALVPNAKFKIETDLAPVIQNRTGTRSPPADSVRPRTCLANCSSSRPECRRHTSPIPNFRRQSRT